VLNFIVERGEVGCVVVVVHAVWWLSPGEPVQIVD
jgi:hypothetical protein